MSRLLSPHILFAEYALVPTQGETFSALSLSWPANRFPGVYRRHGGESSGPPSATRTGRRNAPGRPGCAGHDIFFCAQGFAVRLAGSRQQSL